MAFQSVGSNRPFIKVLALLTLVVIVFWVLAQFPELVIILIVSGLLAFILKPLVTFLEYRTGLRRSLAILVVFLVTGGSLIALTVNIIPVIIDRAQNLYTNLKSFPFDEKITEAATSLSAQFPVIDPVGISQKVYGLIAAGTDGLGVILGGIAGFIVNLVIVPFITFFILSEGDTSFKRWIERVPNKYFEMTLNVLHRMGKDLVGYMRGWILDSVIVGVLSMVGYLIIGVEYPFLIGTIAGVANLVPYLGPVGGAVPAFLVSLIQFGDFRMAGPIIILTLIIQMIDNMIVQPIAFSKTVDMHPVTVIFVLIVGNTLMGVAGMLLAIPLATILKATAVETYWGLKHYQITA